MKSDSIPCPKIVNDLIYKVSSVEAIDWYQSLGLLWFRIERRDMSEGIPF